MAITVDRSALVTALVGDAGFINRLQSLFVSAADQIMAESPGTDPRRSFASKVFQQPRQVASNAAAFMTEQDNLVNQQIVVVPMGSGFAVLMELTDANALSQIVSVWDDLAELFG